MSIDWENGYDELRAHVGHKIVCVRYGREADPINVAIECEDCVMVLVVFDKEERGEVMPEEKFESPTEAKIRRAEEAERSPEEWDRLELRAAVEKSTKRALSLVESDARKKGWRVICFYQEEIRAGYLQNGVVAVSQEASLTPNPRAYAVLDWVFNHNEAKASFQVGSYDLTRDEALVEFTERGVLSPQARLASKARATLKPLQSPEFKRDSEYGEEAVLTIVNSGYELRTDAGPPGDPTFACEYLRVVAPDGRETGYWDNQEWHDDPMVVMGAIMAPSRGSR